MTLVAPGMFKMGLSNFLKSSSACQEVFQPRNHLPPTSLPDQHSFPPARTQQFFRWGRGWQGRKEANSSPFHLLGPVHEDLYSLPLLLSRAWISHAVGVHQNIERSPSTRVQGKGVLLHAASNSFSGRHTEHSVLEPVDAVSPLEAGSQGRESFWKDTLPAPLKQQQWGFLVSW